MGKEVRERSGICSEEDGQIRDYPQIPNQSSVGMYQNSPAVPGQPMTLAGETRFFLTMVRNNSYSPFPPSLGF